MIQKLLREIENVRVPKHIIREFSDHQIRGRKDCKQSAIIQTLLRAKRETPDMSIESLYFLAHGYKQAQR